MEQRLKAIYEMLGAAEAAIALGQTPDPSSDFSRAQERLKQMQHGLRPDIERLALRVALVRGWQCLLSDSPNWEYAVGAFTLDKTYWQPTPQNKSLWGLVHLNCALVRLNCDVVTQIWAWTYACQAVEWIDPSMTKWLGRARLAVALIARLRPNEADVYGSAKKALGLLDANDKLRGIATLLAEHGYSALADRAPAPFFSITDLYYHK